ncbi:hypothetical protein N7520_007267 [Penicillium odoratum]|uniref:uncharacterized protein n=1 Tax=Penicillium odoratum TaxID=1167516 RepID=UPI002548AF4F|nr:uncharacterized protein N7520_007267 [Penicillium odoratum]KAJ5760111.1 hypothetical protein N7520_007267 [Penicillium odoratum]
MATAQMTATGPRSARLADDAATAALYAVQPRRKASVREKPASDIQNQGLKRASTLSAASAGAAIAHANQKPVEIWRPGRLTEAETAALCVKDFKAPEIPKPSTQYSAEGLGAAILAVREQRNSNLSPTREAQQQEYSRHAQDKALRAATGAYATGRKRADSAPIEPVITSDSQYALSAAGVSHRNQIEEEEPLDHLDGAMEASRIRHLANANAKLYTSAPPISSEVQERNRKNSLHAAAISMAKEMYDPNSTKSPRSQSRNTAGGTQGSAIQRAMTLQEAAQKRAAEKLALMHNEQAEFQNYYGTTPQPPRSRLTVRRKRTSSDADATQTDAEQSRYIRNQMRSLRTKVNDVDEKRTRDRALLMEAAQRNVDATILGMERKMYADTGRAPPSLQKEWDEAARERVRREAEVTETNTSARGDRVAIGSQQYMDMADVEAVARSRLQPTFDEITENAEQKRAQELEARLDADEQERHAAIEREREASMTRATDSRTKGSDKEKRNSRVMGFLWRVKSKRARFEKSPSEEAVAQKVANEEASNEEPEAQEEATQDATTAAAAVLPGESNEEPKAELEQEQEPEQDLGQEAEQEAEQKTEQKTEEEAEQKTEQEAEQEAEKEAEQEAEQEAALVQAPDAPETAGAASLATAAHVGAPVSTEPTEYGGPAMLDRPHTAPRDAAAVGAGSAPMHDIRPITSPRADSKLRHWFRDQLVRRSSGPVRVYPHQPGPEFNSGSEIGFTGGAALTRPDSARGAALGSHPVTGDDLDQGESARNGSLDVGQTRFSNSSAGSIEPETKVTKSKRERLRKTFRKSVSRTDESKANGSGTVPETKVQGTDIRGLRDSANDQGLPIPPVLGEAASTGRESRFSEDLS